MFKPDELLISLRIIDLCICFWSGQGWNTLQFCFLSLTSGLFSLKELLAEFRQELDAAKREIIEGMSAAIEDFYVKPEQGYRQSH